MKKYICTIILTVLALSSCSKDEGFNGIDSSPKPITAIRASTGVPTRATVSPTDATKIIWETGDQLGVLGTNGSSGPRNIAYSSETDLSGSDIGYFRNDGSDITAISVIMHPYQESASWNDGKLTCEIPSVQTAVKGSFDKAAAILYSIGNSTNAVLKTAVNFLKITVGSEEAGLHSIAIHSATTPLSGTIEISSSGIAAESGQSLNGVTLTAGKGNFLEPGDYYVAVRACDIENPTISYLYYDNDNHSAIEKSKTYERQLSFASGTNTKPVSVDFTTGTVTTHEAIQLWEGSPYYATTNIYAETPEDWGVGFKFTETGPNDKAATIWGPHWRVPTKDQLGEFPTAIIGESAKLAYSEQNQELVFFTGMGEYQNNTLTIKLNGGVFGTGFWSGTKAEDNDKSWYVILNYIPYSIGFFQQSSDAEYYVRPVLSDN